MQLALLLQITLNIIFYFFLNFVIVPFKIVKVQLQLRKLKFTNGKIAN